MDYRAVAGMSGKPWYLLRPGIGYLASLWHNRAKNMKVDTLLVPVTNVHLLGKIVCNDIRIIVSQDTATY